MIKDPKDLINEVKKVEEFDWKLTEKLNADLKKAEEKKVIPKIIE